jgi:hypothetical protein
VAGRTGAAAPDGAEAQAGAAVPEKDASTVPSAIHQTPGSIGTVIRGTIRPRGACPGVAAGMV